MQSYENLKKEEKSNLVERLAYIDFKLQFTGFVKRSEIGEMFNVADAASSKALSAYSLWCKGNMEYDLSQKVNVISRDSFNSLLMLDAEVALGMLANGFNKNKLPGASTTLIPYEKIDRVPNKLSIDCVAKITRALSGGYAISCKYYSENSSNHNFRTIVPLALMHDGTSWLFRGYDRDDSAKLNFKNFHFSRVSDVIELYNDDDGKKEEKEGLSNDKEWNLRIPLELRLHSTLDESTKRKIRLEFGIPEREDEIMIPVRCSFLWILLRKWFIDDRSELEKLSDNESKVKKFYKFELINKETVLFLKNSI
ncbi:WYL domain-containing protein [Shewanella sedimentimangrovi]|uniref:WYL domain-containing protein n=2 Tax=Shewanella sedimentimangrovi TaxID=2814293 RepID=A0ABX7R794_9GAMM|nr:WYL domain-containing protein [Shewanella sedimentimangrovi]